jgi:hypothetical protein
VVSNEAGIFHGFIRNEYFAPFDYQLTTVPEKKICLECLNLGVDKLMLYFYPSVNIVGVITVILSHCARIHSHLLAD